MNKPASQTVRGRSILTLSLPRIRLNANMPSLISVVFALYFKLFNFSPKATV